MSNGKLVNLLNENSSCQVFGDFLDRQLEVWPLAKKNYQALQKVEVKEFQFEESKIIVQFNPERIRSSAAKVDSESIAKRDCFLCLDKIPPEQKNIEFGNDFVILVNPFPILPKHFTIPSCHHVDQRFENNVKTMLSLSKQMQAFTIFYNGPKCGASAPDHMHFQAGSKDFMPVEKEYESMNSKGELLFASEKIQVRAFPDYLRRMISVESEDVDEIYRAVSKCYKLFSELQKIGEEPLLNAISYYRNGKYVVHLFPRKLHRPWQYFAEGEQQILISPASVDFGGVFITPRREDFESITKENVVDIFKQVSVDKGFFTGLCRNISEGLR